MIAAEYTIEKKLIVRDYPIRKLEAKEILIKVTNCGVCGTDHHIISGKAAAKPPVILGHEYSGIIVELGAKVNNFSVNDKVVINPNIHCGYCKYCKKGMINHCENLKALGVTMNGGFAEYSIIPSTQIYKLPADFNLSFAAFAEPLSCCLRGIEHADIKPADSVIIVGGGSIGLMMIQLARLSGASKIILVEPIENKRNIALELGVDLCLDPFKNDTLELINDYTDGGADIVIECVGKKSTVEFSIDIVGKGGSVVVFGLAPIKEIAEIDLQKIFNKEIRISNSYLNPFTFNTAVDLLISERINVEPLITLETSLTKINEVFLSDNHTSDIKIQVTN